ncbi:MAG: FHA domain-containing protein [Lachnoclostridium sp.]|nr:FHA domain-containing protein [Lachnospira sp.]MCM1248816.1 FHA domain-containing protein [Lachnoclostridium sp.]
MTHGKWANNFIVIENGQLTVYPLDDKIAWEIGRVSKENRPDIILHSTTVSRKHGRFQNVDGVWFYLDYNGKNGTVYNQKHITSGLNGRVKPVVLKDGDVFVFGGTVWGLYITREWILV